MERELGSRGETRILAAQKRDWQLWSALVLGLVVLGVGLCLYGFLHAPPEAWSEQDLSRLVPPLLYGLLALLVLVNFYIAQKEAIIHSLRQELVEQKIEAELNRELSLLDPVTEVYNRRYLRALLTKEVGRAKRYDQGLSVMLVDITGFRRVNESLGHTGGDVVLRQTAQLFQKRIRNSDSIVRFGGDEFLLILSDTDDPHARQLGERLREGFREWSQRRGMVEFGLRLAIGVAAYSPNSSIDEMIGTAEQRMFRDRHPAEPERSGSGVPTPSARASS